MIEGGCFGVQPPPGLGTPSDDAGEGLPSGGFFIRFRDASVVAQAYREGGGELALGVSESPYERFDGRVPEPGLDEGEFRTAGAQAVVGLDEGGTGLAFQYGERSDGRLGGYDSDTGSSTGTAPTGAPHIPVPREYAYAADGDEGEDEVGAGTPSASR